MGIFDRSKKLAKDSQKNLDQTLARHSAIASRDKAFSRENVEYFTNDKKYSEIRADISRSILKDNGFSDNDINPEIVSKVEADLNDKLFSNISGGSNFEARQKYDMMLVQLAEDLKLNTEELSGLKFDIASRQAVHQELIDKKNAPVFFEEVENVLTEMSETVSEFPISLWNDKSSIEAEKGINFFWILFFIGGILFWIYYLIKDKTRYFYFKLKARDHLPKSFKKEYEFVICVKNAPTNSFGQYSCDCSHEKPSVMSKVNTGITIIDKKPNIDNSIYLALTNRIEESSMAYYDILGEEINNKKAKNFIQKGVETIYYI